MRARPFAPQEIAILSEALRARGDVRGRALLLTGCRTGFRISELLTLRVGDVLSDEGKVAREVTVTRASLKGGRGAHRRSVRSRRVVLHEEARAAIGDLLFASGQIPASDEFLFRSREGGNRAISRSRAHQLLFEWCVSCGIDSTRVSTHSLRKTFAARVFEASGRDLVRTQRIIGHRSPVTTALYLESTQRELDDIVLGSLSENALSGALPRSSAPSPRGVGAST